jgi:hypothetical protein
MGLCGLIVYVMERKSEGVTVDYRGLRVLENLTELAGSHIIN